MHKKYREFHIKYKGTIILRVFLPQNWEQRSYLINYKFLLIGSWTPGADNKKIFERQSF